MSKVSVSPGVCGFSTTIESYVNDSFQATVTIESQCPQVLDLAERLGKISVLEELKVPINETSVYRAAGQCRLHAACPVPLAILKAIEIAADLALPIDVHLTIES